MQSLKCTVFFVFAALLIISFKPSEPPEKTEWLSLQQAIDNLKGEQRPVLIDLYTDWCGWCKVMDKKTYSNKNVSKYLAAKFYPVKINAEGHQPIRWKNKTYSFNTSYKTHEFAIYLTNGQLSYPTTVIIASDGIPQAIPGYLSPSDFELILKYFGEGAYGKKSFEDFKKTFKPEW